MDANFVYGNWQRFAALHSGLQTAFGTGAGRWVKRAPCADDWVNHLLGRGPGIGIAPLRPDNTVMFAAIDLDEPDFDAAREMQGYLPGCTWLEHSRSGNAHVLAYFSGPIPAWVPMGILKEATLAAGKPHVEVFPKNHDFSMVKFGNYINLSYHGDQRKIESDSGGVFELQEWIEHAEDSKNDPAKWITRADWLQIHAPDQRERTAEFGEQINLHICGQHIIDRMDENPVLRGHRAVVFFSLAKMLTNWSQCDHEEALHFMRSVNEASPDSISDSELRRILGNAERGQFTSTGCDDPLFAPYAHPDCKIANPRS